jgi:hypothetical protein
LGLNRHEQAHARRQGDQSTGDIHIFLGIGNLQNRPREPSRIGQLKPFAAFS